MKSSKRSTFIDASDATTKSATPDRLRRGRCRRRADRNPMSGSSTLPHAHVGVEVAAQRFLAPSRAQSSASHSPSYSRTNSLSPGESPSRYNGPGRLGRWEPACSMTRSNWVARHPRCGRSSPSRSLASWA